AMIGVAVFRASLYQTRTSTWRLWPTAAWLVLLVGVAGTAYAFLTGRAAGPLSYGGRYLALPDPVSYLRSVVQNAAILVYVGLGWIALPALFGYAKRQTRKERAAMLIAGLSAAALVVPQLLLYSQQGIFEGKY